MDEEPYVADPDDVSKVLRVMKEEFFDLIGMDKERESRYSFLVHMLPIFLPGFGSYEVINGFNLILDGACAQPDSSKMEKTRVSVIELVAGEGSLKGHSYIVTPINFKGTFSGNGIGGYYSYIFVKPATSGYDGTGPDIQRSIQASIDNKIPVVKQRVVNVSSTESLEGLFYERGPIVDIFFPRFEIPIGFRKYDERFMQ